MKIYPSDGKGEPATINGDYGMHIKSQLQSGYSVATVSMLELPKDIDGSVPSDDALVEDLVYRKVDFVMRGGRVFAATWDGFQFLRQRNARGIE